MPHPCHIEGEKGRNSELSLSTSENTGTVAVVQLTARVTLSTNDAPPEARVRFYQLTMGRDAGTGRWLVARPEQS